MNLPFIIVSSCLFVLWLADFLLGIHRAKHNNRIHRSWYHDVQEALGRLRDRASDLEGAELPARVRNAEDRISELQEATGGFWRTARGNILMIRQMSDAHIENAIAHLKEVAYGDPMKLGKGYEDLRTEQKRRARDRRLSPTYQVEIGIERPGDVLRRLAGETAPGYARADECRRMIANETKGVEVEGFLGRGIRFLSPTGNMEFTEFPNGYESRLTSKGIAAREEWRRQQEAAEGRTEIDGMIPRPPVAVDAMAGCIPQSAKDEAKRYVEEMRNLPKVADQIDWPEVDKVLKSLIERVGLSSLKHDMHKLAHLLRRGRAGK